MNKKIQLFDPNENFFSSHVTFTSVADITLLSQPLLALGLTYFTFDRTYKDGSHIRLTNAGSWIESYYREKLYNNAIFEKNPSIFRNGHAFWSSLQREPIYSAAAKHDIDHGLTITQIHPEYCDFYHFGTRCQNYISRHALESHLQFLNDFIYLFKVQGKTLIDLADRTRFILPLKSHEVHVKDIRNFNGPEDNHIFEAREIRRLYLGEDFQNAYLTQQEINILAFLRSGKKPVQIAKQLNLSERTVEAHTRNIKAKLKCKSLFSLGFATHDLGIHNLFRRQ